MTASSSHLAGKEKEEEKKKGFTGTAVPDSQINFKRRWNTVEGDQEERLPFLYSH